MTIQMIYYDFLFISKKNDKRPTHGQMRNVNLSLRKCYEMYQFSQVRVTNTYFIEGVCLDWVGRFNQLENGNCVKWTNEVLIYLPEYLILPHW